MKEVLRMRTKGMKPEEKEKYFESIGP